MAMKKVEAGRRIQKSHIRACHKHQGTWRQFVAVREEKYAAGGVCRDESWLFAMKVVPISPETRKAVQEQRRLRRKRQKELAAELVAQEAARPSSNLSGNPLMDWVFDHMAREPLSPPPAGYLGALEYFRLHPDKFYREYLKWVAERHQGGPEASSRG